MRIRAFTYFSFFVFFSFEAILSAFGQNNNDNTNNGNKTSKDSLYIIKLDTLLHLQSWISKSQMEYTVVYNENFKLVLAPNLTNNLSLGFSYRYLELGISFSPYFLNAGQEIGIKGDPEQFSFRASFS